MGSGQVAFSSRAALFGVVRLVNLPGDQSLPGSSAHGGSTLTCFCPSSGLAPEINA